MKSIHRVTPTLKKETMKKCSSCKEDLKYIAGGISKKGNRYEAFWGCKSKDCKNTETPTPEEVKKFDLEARMNKMEEEQIRFKEMAWFNATNAAVEVTKVDSQDIPMKPEAMEGNIKEWRDFFYKEHMEWFIKNIINEED